MLRPITLSRATQSLHQLATPSPFTPIVLPLNQALIQAQIQTQTRQKSTINKHRLPKKKFLAFRTDLAKDAPTAAQPTSVPGPKSEPTTPIPEPRGPPPFVITRTASQNLPIYPLSKRGGNKKLTLIRKLEGDRNALAEWLAEDLGLDKKKVRVKAPTNHVELEGEHVEAVKTWFEARGF